LAHNEWAYRLSRRVKGLLRYALRRPHEPEFAAFRLWPNRRRLFLDIGANVGQSALSPHLFRPHQRILSIEANPYHERDLRFLRHILPKFDYVICGAGAESSEATLHVPTFRCVPITGEASFERSTAEESQWLKEHLHASSSPDFGVEAHQVQVRRIDELGLRPDFVKIDVERAEVAVLRGMAETIERCRPIFLIEISADFEAMRQELEPRGYRSFRYVAKADSLVPLEGQHRGNIFWIPTAPEAATAS